MRLVGIVIRKPIKALQILKRKEISSAISVWSIAGGRTGGKDMKSIRLVFSIVLLRLDRIVNRLYCWRYRVLLED